MHMFETRDLWRKYAEKNRIVVKTIFAYKTKDIDCTEKKFDIKNVDIQNTYKMRRGTLKSILVK